MHVAHIPGVRGQATAAPSANAPRRTAAASTFPAPVLPSTSAPSATSATATASVNLSLRDTPNLPLTATATQSDTHLNDPTSTATARAARSTTSSALDGSSSRRKRARSPSPSESSEKRSETRRAMTKIDLSERDAIARMSIRDIIQHTTGGAVSSTYLARRAAKRARKDELEVEVLRVEKGEGDEDAPAEDEERGEEDKQANVARAKVDDAALVPQMRIEDGRIVMAAQQVTLPAGPPTLAAGDGGGAAARRGAAGTGRTRVDKWSAIETQLFYVALRQCGSDFTLIQKLFPTRTRKQIRNKFKKEERTHSRLIDYAFAHPLPFDLAPFRRHGTVAEDLPIDLDANDVEEEEAEREEPIDVVEPEPAPEPEPDDEERISAQIDAAPRGVALRRSARRLKAPTHDDGLV